MLHSQAKLNSLSSTNKSLNQTSSFTRRPKSPSVGATFGKVQNQRRFDSKSRQSAHPVSTQNARHKPDLNATTILLPQASAEQENEELRA